MTTTKFWVRGAMCAVHIIVISATNLKCIYFFIDEKSCHVSLVFSNLWHIFSLFFVFHALNIFEDNWSVTYRMFPNLEWSLFFRYYIEIMSFCQGYHWSDINTLYQGPHVRIWFISVDVSLYHLAKMMSARFLNCETLFFPLQSVSIFWGDTWRLCIYPISCHTFVH